jgi:hypothetical protein
VRLVFEAERVGTLFVGHILIVNFLGAFAALGDDLGARGEARAQFRLPRLDVLHQVDVFGALRERNARK